LVDTAQRGECQECAATAPRPQDPPEQWLTKEGVMVAVQHDAVVLQRRELAPMAQGGAPRPVHRNGTAVRHADHGGPRR
jgi:hypothetical protein